MNKRIFAVAMAALLALTVGVPAFAEDTLSANDLTVGALTAPATYGNFAITASAEKGASVDALDVARTAPDAELFNARIKLGGAGNADYRSIVFSTAAKAEITVYLASSSKTDARVVNLVSAADGSIVAELAAPADDGATAFVAKGTVPAAGKYYLTSKSGGVYVFGVTVK